MINSKLQDDHNKSSESYSEFDVDNNQENKSASESDDGVGRVGEVAENLQKKIH